MRCLVVNADDFGFTPDVNAGILRAHREGIVTAATLMANGNAFHHAVRLAQETPSLDLGCHLVFVEGPSLATPGQRLPASVGQLLVALLRRRIHLHAEGRAQLERLLAAGIQPSHLDTHKHTHLLLPVLEVLGRLAREYGIRWIRRPIDLPWSALPDDSGAARQAVSALTRLLDPPFRRTLQRYQCATTDHFAGFRITGRFQDATLAATLRRLPPGSTELVCHPGVCGEHLLRAPTRLKASRQRELGALISPLTRAAVEECGIRLVGFRDLPAPPARRWPQPA